MSAWLVDLDGTLALKRDRGPYDWDRVGEDDPNLPVIAIVQALMRAGYPVILVSGRMEQARRPTMIWLNAGAGIDTESIDGLFMRADGDYRPDDVVKREIYDTRIVPLLQSWHPAEPLLHKPFGVIDDRSRVCDMWESLGLFVLRCKDATADTPTRS